MKPIYSICTTSYNSASAADGFAKPLLKLDEKFEIIVVDNISFDGTADAIKKYEPRIKVFSEKCTRGGGRQKAMELSNGSIIIHVDFDVSYSGILEAVKFYESSNKDKIYYIQAVKHKCSACLYIGRRELFDKVDGFPNMNHSDDTYFNKKTNAVGLLSIISLEMSHDCLDVRGLSSGAESRYERTKLKQAIRRIIATRDILFVNGFSYTELMKKYRLSGKRAFFEGLPEYLLGKILRFTIKVPTVESEIKAIKSKMNSDN